MGEYSGIYIFIAILLYVPMWLIGLSKCGY